ELRVDLLAEAIPPPGKPTPRALQRTREPHGLGLHHARDRQRQPLPLSGFGLEAPAARPGQPVVLGAAVVLGGSPVGVDEAALLDAMERRVERALLDA